MASQNAVRRPSRSGGKSAARSSTWLRTGCSAALFCALPSPLGLPRSPNREGGSKRGGSSTDAARVPAVTAGNSGSERGVAANARCSTPSLF
eukprot:4605481-Pleurochrysis_carterae.AAC.1